jgi:hypothetical protein
VASQGSFILIKLDFIVENVYSSNVFAILTNGMFRNDMLLASGFGWL